ncbi:DUF5071 domain-containing protein [Mycena kentingensis (nom. inval.)]|nr:DUF5071 domain-containing protein [Mycena kentingensis (nom. inval.)]
MTLAGKPLLAGLFGGASPSATGSVTEFERALISRISALPEDCFAPLIPELLLGLAFSLETAFHYTTMEAVRHHLVERICAAEPTTSPVISAINTLLMVPAESVSDATLKSGVFGWAGVLPSTPVARLSIFRPGLLRLSENPSLLESGGSIYSLAEEARRLINYIDDPRPWLPTSKSDWLGLRSLDAITTAEEMSPFVRGLLEWLQDMNWPVSGGAWKHLARFPGLCVEPIREVLQSGDDESWEAYLLDFVADSVPIQLWQQMRPELERAAQQPSDDERDSGVDERAMDLLHRLDEWKDRPRRQPHCRGS